MATIIKKALQAEARAASKHAAQAKADRRPDVAVPARLYAKGVRALARRVP